jgi:SAM-dependent methyltransferase
MIPTRIRPENWTCPEHGTPLSIISNDPIPDGVPWPDGEFRCSSGCSFPIRGGIPRFVSSGAYSEAFGWQWRKYRRTQLDSYTGLSVSRNRLEHCLGMPVEGLKGKVVLECGSGAGRFTELLLGNCDYLVSTDLSDAVDANLENLKDRGPKYTLLQSDLNKSPLPREAFDVLICMGVLPFTPSPEASIRKLISHLKPGGLLVIDHYKRETGLRALEPYLTLGYPLRAVLKRLNRETGLKATKALTAICDPIRKRTCHYKWLHRIVGRFLPSVCYYNQYPELPSSIAYEWNELDTHNVLTAYHKHLRRPDELSNYVRSLGMEIVSCCEAGNGIEIRAIRSTMEGKDAVPARELRIAELSHTSSA